MGDKGWSAYERADAVQATVTQWRESRAGAAGRTCVDCHMPRGTHALRGLGDHAFVQSALRADAVATRRGASTSVRIDLEAADVGHRMPTGDMFRRLRVRVESEDGTVRTRWLGRRFASMPNHDEIGFALRPVLDQRLPAPAPGVGPTRLEFELPPTSTVAWSVDLFRMPPAVAQRRGLPSESVRVPLLAGQTQVQ
jgi:hypothetical protein